MTTKRPYYRTKWQWAEAKAAELRLEETSWRTRHVPSADWRGIRGKMTALESIGRDRRKFEALAERFRAEGV